MKKFVLEVQELPFKDDFLSLHFTVYFSTYKEVYVKCDDYLTDEILLYSGEEEYKFLLNSILRVVRCVMRNYRMKCLSSLSFTSVVKAALSDYEISCSFNKKDYE